MTARYTLEESNKGAACYRAFRMVPDDEGQYCLVMDLTAAEARIVELDKLIVQCTDAVFATTAAKQAAEAVADRRLADLQAAEVKIDMALHWLDRADIGAADVDDIRAALNGEYTEDDKEAANRRRQDAERYAFIRSRCYFNVCHERDWPHFVVKPQWTDANGGICSFLVGSESHVGVMSLDGAVDHLRAIQAELTGTPVADGGDNVCSDPRGHAYRIPDAGKESVCMFCQAVNKDWPAK